MAFTLGTLADLRRDGVKNVHLSAVCPDGIWTPMLFDRLDDPDAAPSFSGTLLRAEDVAPKVVALLDEPRPVLTIPRWRGAFVRLFDAFPALATRIIPLWFADARRRQRRWKKRIEAGKGPTAGRSRACDSAFASEPRLPAFDLAPGPGLGTLAK